MPSIFSRIVAGEIPCAKVWENDEFLAFLDILPVAPGHTLVVTKQEVDYLFDLDPGQYRRLMDACRVVARGLRKATGCRKVALLVYGLEVPHAHVHLIPIHREGQLPLPRPAQAAPEALQKLAEKLRLDIRAAFAT